MNKKELERNYKTLRMCFFILTIMNLITFFCLLYAYYLQNDSPKLYSRNETQIYFDGFDNNEIKLIDEVVLKNIKPLYLTDVDEITITKDINKFLGYDCKCDGNSQITRGRNKIAVAYYEGNIGYLKYVISHEIMHTYIKNYGQDGYLHDMVADLGEQNVVFKR